MKKLIDLEDPFFAPLWIRVCVVLVTTCWGLFELWRGATLWGVVFLGVSAVCAWRFATIKYDTDPKD